MAGDGASDQIRVTNIAPPSMGFSFPVSVLKFLVDGQCFQFCFAKQSETLEKFR